VALGLRFEAAFVREKLKESYGETGRPSIDPELLLRILLIDYLYGITRERKLVEELRMHLAWRWSGFRSGDPASLRVLEKPSWTVSGIEAVRGAV
jgi:transposase